MTKRRITCGVDLGLLGAIAFIGEETVVVPTPILQGKKKIYDVHAIADVFRTMGAMHDMHVLVEQGQYRGMNGTRAAFSTGYGQGCFSGILTALGISYELVQPQTWQKVMYRGTKGEGKQRSIEKAKQLFPDVSLKRTDRSRKDCDGMADALLIAEYGRRLKD